MPDLARVLAFRPRAAAISASEATALVSSYLAGNADCASTPIPDECFYNPDVLLALSGSLLNQLAVAPQLVANESVSAFERISDSSGCGLFDERDYFLGEFAFLAGTTFRLLGKRELALTWLERADSSFRHTINPAPGLTNVAYARLSLAFDKGEYVAVSDSVGAVRESFSRLGMSTQEAKCGLLEAAALKQLGRNAAALLRLEAAAATLRSVSERSLLSRVLVEMGDVYQLQNETPQAVIYFQQAAALLDPSETSVFSADLKMFLGAAYSGQGQFAEAFEALRAARSDYAILSMDTRTAYVSLYLADTLLRLGQPRQAEWEILAALPVIQGQNMVPECSAAIGLLSESARQKKANPEALSEILSRLHSRR
ncbi:MAG: hypothetical protein ABJC61_12925 [Acidobacteriota bacterium]